MQHQQQPEETPQENSGFFHPKVATSKRKPARGTRDAGDAKGGWWSRSPPKMEYDVSVQKCLVAFQSKDSFTLRHHSPIK